MDSYATVRSLEDCMRWVDHAINIVDKLPNSSGAGSDMLHAALNKFTLSIAFSGIGASETSLELFFAALARRGKARSRLRSLFFIESDQECRYELQMMPCYKEACWYSDMRDFMKPTLRQRLTADVGRMTYPDVFACMMHAKALKTSAPCLRHGKSCVAMRAAVHVAGCPCVAWSQFGNRGGCSGESLVVFMTWVVQRRHVQENGILTENVEGMTPALWKGLFGDLYVIDMCVIDSRSLGQLQKRVRRLVWMRHKRTVVMPPNAPVTCRDTLTMSFEVFVALFHREVDNNSVSWKDLFRADDDELETEFKCEQARHHMHETWDVPGNTFEQALCEWDSRNLQIYKVTNPDSIVQLNQSATAMPLTNNGAPWLQTVISNCGCLWSTHHGRWLTLDELLVTQGFAVYDDLLLYDEDYSWCHRRSDFQYPARSASHVRRQVGNTMHVAVMGISFLHWFVHVDFPIITQESTPRICKAISSVQSFKRLRVQLSNASDSSIGSKRRRVTGKQPPEALGGEVI